MPKVETGDRGASGSKQGASISITETAHAVLRRETALWHKAVEDAFAGLDLARRADLALFLQAQAQAVFAIERELDLGGIDRLLPDWPTRRRSDAMKADLQQLGLAPPPLSSLSGRFADLGHQLGALYVLEGSRLGGRLLARHVAASPDPAVARVTTFLRHVVHPGAWAGFLVILNATPAPVSAIVQGAVEAFRLYHAAAVAVTGPSVATEVRDDALVGQPGA